MIEKVVTKRKQGDARARIDDLAYWASRPSEERVATVDYLVEYIIVGGYALALHGAPRFTG